MFGFVREHVEANEEHNYAPRGAEGIDGNTEDLEQQNREISARDEKQRASIDRLGKENFELRAGARWPEWITGAGLLAAGMMMGAILHRINSSRQRGPRIRL